jgi:hypothetical protein
MSVVVWKMVPTCHLWCLWRENKCFEGLGEVLGVHYIFFLSYVVSWTAAFVSPFDRYPLSINYDDFLVRFFSFLVR